jgi:outer membrane protein with beta-barrel domain
MHDPKFEKEVQQKMEGLEFTPPAAVWLKVERAVSQTRPRRAPVFWLFFFAGIILLGSGGIFLATRRNGPAALTNTNPGASNRASGTNHAIAANPPAGLSDKDNPAAVQGSAGKNATEADGRTSGRTENTTEATANATEGTAGTTKRNGNATHSEKAVPMGTAERSSTRTSEHNNSLIASNNGTGVQTQTNRNRTGTYNSTNNNNNRGAADRMNNGKVKTGDLASISGAKGDVASLYRKILSSSSGLKATDKKSVQKLQMKPKHSWEGGFDGGVGTSSMNQNLFRKTTINALDLRQNAGTAVTSYGALPPPKVSTSKIQPDISFWAGIVVQKQLSDRFTFATGLNLHYYSTRLRTGDQVANDSSALAPASSYFNNTSLAAIPAPAAPYYPVGSQQTYMNKYYFLELPVSVQWRLNNSRSLPLFWEGGLSLSYLMSSDALYYNTSDGVYYKDGAVANRTQLNASTSVMIGLPVKGMRLQAGPQLQYGISRILNEGAAGDGHMFFAGIKLVVLPGKLK